MYIEAYDIDKLDAKMYSKGFYTKTKNFKIIEDFVNSGLNCAEVKEFTNKSSYGCATSLNVSIKRFKVAGIKAIVCKNRVFLVKTDM